MGAWPEQRWEGRIHHAYVYVLAPMHLYFIRNVAQLNMVYLCDYVLES